MIKENYHLQINDTIFCSFLINFTYIQIQIYLKLYFFLILFLILLSCIELYSTRNEKMASSSP